MHTLVQLCHWRVFSVICIIVTHVVISLVVADDFVITEFGSFALV